MAFFVKKVDLTKKCYIIFLQIALKIKNEKLVASGDNK